MGVFEEFRAIVESEAPLGSLTAMRVGGPAQWLATPSHPDELARLVLRCRGESIPYRILAGGSNILVADEGVRGMVIRLSADAFRSVSLRGTTAAAGAGAPLADLIAAACQAHASGLEVLVGIPGTVGGAVLRNAGGRNGDIGQFVEKVDVLDDDGQVTTRHRADIRFGYRKSNLDGVVVLSATFELAEDDPDSIVRRIKKVWIGKKATQPFGFQAAGYIFRDPRGLNATLLIDTAGMSGAKVGGAELSDRDSRFIIAHPGATSRDVLRLIDLVRSKVEERTGVHLDLQIDVW